MTVNWTKYKKLTKSNDKSNVIDFIYNIVKIGLLIMKDKMIINWLPWQNAGNAHSDDCLFFYPC